MEKKKLNCWEFMKCQRQHGERHVSDLGICPATQEKRLDSVHGVSMQEGVAGLSSREHSAKGKSRGLFARKFNSCQICDFYQTVKKEEFHNFQLSAVLMKKIADR
jgi:hypothetical protein